MANFSPILSNLKFEARSTDEYLKPYLLYQQAYKEREAQIDELNRNMSAFAPYAEQDGEFKQLYENTNKAIQENADKIGTPYFLRDKASLRALKKQYYDANSKLSNAVNNFNEAQKLKQQYMMNDDSARFAYTDEAGNASSSDINAYMNNGKPVLRKVSGVQMQQDALNSAKALTNRISISESGYTGPHDGGEYRDYMLKQNVNINGVSTDVKVDELINADAKTIEKWKNGDVEHREIAKIAEDFAQNMKALKEESNYKYLDKQGKSDIDNYIERGIFQGLGYQVQRNTDIHELHPKETGGSGAEVAYDPSLNLDVFELGAQNTGNDYEEKLDLIANPDGSYQLTNVELMQLKKEADADLAKCKETYAKNSQKGKSTGYKGLDDLTDRCQTYDEAIAAINNADNETLFKAAGVEQDADGTYYMTSQGKHTGSRHTRVQISKNPDDARFRAIVSLNAKLNEHIGYTGSAMSDYQQKERELKEEADKWSHLGDPNAANNVMRGRALEKSQSARAIQGFSPTLNRSKDQKEYEAMMYNEANGVSQEGAEWASDDSTNRPGVYTIDGKGNKTFTTYEDFKEVTKDAKSIIPWDNDEGSGWKVDGKVYQFQGNKATNKQNREFRAAMKAGCDYSAEGVGFAGMATTDNKRFAELTDMLKDQSVQASQYGHATTQFSPFTPGTYQLGKGWEEVPVENTNTVLYAKRIRNGETGEICTIIVDNQGNLRNFTTDSDEISGGSLSYQWRAANAVASGKMKKYVNPELDK